MFGDLKKGDMFNTKVGRYVKSDGNWAICVMSAIHTEGERYYFYDSDEVLIIYSANTVSNRIG